MNNILVALNRISSEVRCRRVVGSLRYLVNHDVSAS